MSAQHEIELPESKGSMRFKNCALDGLFWKNEADRLVTELAAANARAKELEESFAFLQQQGTTDEDGDFVLHLVLSKHHSGLESVITAWAKREALAKGAA